MKLMLQLLNKCKNLVQVNNVLANFFKKRKKIILKLYTVFRLFSWLYSVVTVLHPSGPCVPVDYDLLQENYTNEDKYIHVFT